ncbi:hypothetical protein Sgly_3261 [Syntrophobotulus glycolicus DSM 8271]|uniref:Uncharacterized protein n=1 Tax=Syntrophobotulus glycolicus (strain DSM 8271 / FlGlyR) TaxID=645991 RepID=F0T296_SYNGF|nr:hypothetical protein [Syntrophobotulus glycolicus]ADY57524.1 hypothetical protein Sgly_3261 [Syntrophobotulus glycolicus DSM 8271]
MLMVSSIFIFWLTSLKIEDLFAEALKGINCKNGEINLFNEDRANKSSIYFWNWGQEYYIPKRNGLFPGEKIWINGLGDPREEQDAILCNRKTAKRNKFLT